MLDSFVQAYDVLKNLGGLSNDELAEVFNAWNKVSVGFELTLQVAAHMHNTPRQPVFA